jgi:D-glutamate N-acetyltransferase
MRALVLAHDKFTPISAKTGVCLLRYRRGDIVGVVDRAKAGTDAGEVVTEARGVPVVRSVEEGLKLQPDTLVIGIAPVGGALPEEWRPDLRMAIERGWTILSGLHVFLADDPELGPLAARHGAQLVDVRRPPARKRIATGDARLVEGTVVLTVGTDCSSGKMTASVELHRESLRRGLPSAFVATGQTGIMVGADAGVVIDAVVGDFMAGETERMVLDCAQRGKRLVWVEGQGSITHPAYSGVSAALLHGASPDWLVLCHDATRRERKGFANFPLAPLREEVTMNEHLLKWTTGGRVVGVALMTLGMSDEEAREAVQRCELETGLPTTDVVRYGPGKLLDAVLQASHDLTRKPTPAYPLKR